MTADKNHNTNAALSTFALLRRIAPLAIPALVGNAIIQAAATLPATTPSGSPAFLALVAVSTAAILASLAFLVGSLQSATTGTRPGFPAWRAWVIALIFVVAVSAAAVVAQWLVPVVATLVFILLPTYTVPRPAPRDEATGLHHKSTDAHLAGAGSTYPGFRAFRLHPLRAILLTLATVVAQLLLWLSALLLGFFITGPLAALITWLIVGVAVTSLTSAWTALALNGVAQKRLRAESPR